MPGIPKTKAGIPENKPGIPENMLGIPDNKPEILQKQARNC